MGKDLIMEHTGAKILMKALKDEGTDTIFGYPGGQVIDIYDELVKTDIRHEHRARFMRLTAMQEHADAWGSAW
jgi:hypothetical protein